MRRLRRFNRRGFRRFHRLISNDFRLRCLFRRAFCDDSSGFFTRRFFSDRGVSRNGFLCDLLSDGLILRLDKLRLGVNRRGNRFRMRGFHNRLLRRSFHHRRLDHHGFSDRRNRCFSRLGFSHRRGVLLQLLLFLFLYTRQRVADPDFTGRHFWRRARDGQRHRRLGRVTLVTVATSPHSKVTATTALAADAQVTRGTARATRHTGVFAARLVGLFSDGRRFHVGWQRQRCGFFTCFSDRRVGGADSFCFRCGFDTHFLAQLARFTARHYLNNAIFLFGLFHRFITVQRADFLLRLTFLFRTTAVAFAARRLRLIVTGFRLIGGLFSNRGAGFTCLGVLLFLTTITAVLFARFAVVTVIAIVAVITGRTLAAFTAIATLVTVATVVLTTTVAALLLFLVAVFRRLLLRLARDRLCLRLAGEQALQRADGAAQEAFFGRRCGVDRRFRRGGFGFRCGGFLRHWRHVRHHERGERRLLRTFTLGVFVFRRQRHRFFMQLRQHVAQGMRLFAFTHTQYGVVRRFHLIVWHDHAAHAALTRFDSGNRFTLLVKQVGGDRHRNDSVNFLGVLFQRFFFNQTQNGERQRFVIADGAGAATARTDVMAGFAKRRAQALTGHLQQAEAGNMANLDARAILTHRFAQTVFHRALVAYRRHIDEVDNDKTA
ncbi:hypothetical protein BN129_665 [Cronobacter sakazakii 701]|nr:hypothetical protein BN129_665 [Cronobacter sakazakii 701]